MKKTLLEITQAILNDMDSDEINSVDDTIESQQVSQIVRTCYEEMVSNRNWPHLKKLLQFEHIGDLSKPNYLVLPEKIKELVQFKYEKQKATQTQIILQDVLYLYPDEFLSHVQARNSDNDNVEIIEDFGGTKLMIFNNFAPTYWTSFDDKYIVTDSYDKEVDDTLKKSKTQAVAYMEPVWVHEDGAYPDLPSEAFSALIHEAMSTASLALKQVANQKAEQKAVRQSRWLSRKAWKAKGGVRYDNYGRKAHTGSQTTIFKKD